MPVTIYKNQKGKLVNATSAYGLEHSTGLWTALDIADINNDGFDDILAGNLGTNSKLHASEKYPLNLYVADLDNNGSLDQIMAIENGEKYYTFLGKEELEAQLPSVIKKKYLGYAAFAGQTIEDVFVNKLDHVKKLSAENLSSVILINNKKDGFIKTGFSPQAQWSPLFGFVTDDFNGDEATDILTVGNFYGVIPYEGRYDANGGTVMLNENNNTFKVPGSLQPGLLVDGETRDIRLIKSIQGRKIIAIARNNGSIKFFTLAKN